MRNIALFIASLLFVFSGNAQENISISFSNDYKDVKHLSLIIYTPDRKIQTRVSNLNPDQVKSYSLPVNTEIFIADWKQEAFAMNGNDIKSTGVKPYIVVKDSDANRVITLSSLGKNKISFQIKDLSTSVGSWEGKLTYLDYSSGKPYTMSANIKISLTENRKGYIMAYEYPKEPQANSKDTTYIVDKLFGKDKIVDFEKSLDGGFTLVSEIVGEDGNDHKKAILRHTYLLKSNSYSITKEVKFEGTYLWIKRNEYLLNKKGK
jgi:hypothetical protein